MKKLVSFLTAMLVFTFPIMAQALKEGEPVETFTLNKGNIPAPVLKSAQELFQGNTKVTWGTFPYELKDYGWSANKDYKGPIDHYEIQFKAKDGSDIYAVFEATGELIKCKIVNKDSPVPKQIVFAIANSIYKDWKIIGNVMQIKSTQKKVDEHYAVKVEKDSKKKTLYFTPNGDLLAVK